eukprot:gene18427-biopygen12366
MSGGGSASALYASAGQEKKKKCVYCEEEHRPEECQKHKDPDERKAPLASQQPTSTSKLQSQQQQQANALDPSAPTWVGSTCSGNEVALQTALAYVDDQREQKVRVLFDSGSQRSFISAKAVKTLGLRPVRRENLEINAFGSRMPDDRERADISNIHIEYVKKLYPHLQTIWFSDVSRSTEKLSIQILVGADYMWEFLEGEERRGGPHEPVATKTALGWVLSGPLKSVVREDSETTKVRIVYDASCKDKVTKISLNDCLHVGPSLTPLIFDILLRFRGMRVGLVGDIAKAFLNIEVNPEDRDCLRFFWVDDITVEDPEIVVYKFNRVVFGVNSSPFLLNAVLRHHLQTFDEVDPDFVALLSKSFYVDDLVAGANNKEAAFQLFNKARDRLQQGGFQLRKWKTNDESLRERICELKGSLMVRCCKGKVMNLMLRRLWGKGKRVEERLRYLV